MIALKVFSLIGREPKGEIVVVAELEFGRLKFWEWNSRVIDKSMYFGPQLSSYLTLGGRSREHDTVAIARKPPENCCCQRERLSNRVASFYCRSAVNPY